MGERIVFKYSSPVGLLYCVFEDAALIEVAIGEDEARGIGQEARGKRERNKGTLPIVQSLSPIARSFFFELDAYFEGNLKAFMHKVKFTFGTPFEQRVWRTLRKIPYGETRSYKWIAGSVGSPGAMRAAGQALGKNPLPIIVPCHRIIAADGSIGGFSSGVAIKQWLLEHEAKNK